MLFKVTLYGEKLYTDDYMTRRVSVWSENRLSNLGGAIVSVAMSVKFLRTNKRIPCQEFSFSIRCSIHEVKERTFKQGRP
jgi:hypothetical protein